eukprot:500548_1
MILVFLLLFARASCETLIYKYVYNISFDLAILFANHWNSTCDQFFGTKNDTLMTLQSINNIFYSTLISHQNKSGILITKIPQTKLTDINYNSISYADCLLLDNVIISNTYFVLNSMNNNTNQLNKFYIDSSISLHHYFMDEKIFLSFHHKSIIISEITNITHVCLSENNYFIGTIFGYVIIIIICVLIFICYVQYKYKQAFVIDHVLVLIIGISKFDTDTMDLPGVCRNVRDLKNLWRNYYNYDVLICNEDTLCCTKEDIIDFIDNGLDLLKHETKYKCAIIHVLSHSSQKDSFLTSDGQKIQLDFLIHELSDIDQYINQSLVKLIFNHCCRGSEHYYFNSNGFAPRYKSEHFGEMVLGLDQKTNHDFEPSLEDTNLILVYGTINDRIMSDSGYFAQAIYDAFSKNSSRIFKHDFWSLIAEISRELQAKTKDAEICSMESTLCYGKVIFKKGTIVASQDNRGFTPVDATTVDVMPTDTKCNFSYSHVSSVDQI